MTVNASDKIDPRRAAIRDADRTTSEQREVQQPANFEDLLKVQRKSEGAYQDWGTGGPDASLKVCSTLVT